MFTFTEVSRYKSHGDACQVLQYVDYKCWVIGTMKKTEKQKKMVSPLENAFDRKFLSQDLLI